MFARFAPSFIAALVLISGAAFAETKLSRGFIPPQEGVAVTELAGGLEYPWAMTALPDGTLVIAQRAGSLRVFKDGKLSDRAFLFPVDVMTKRAQPGDTTLRGQGGLLDIKASPQFEKDNLLYFTFAQGTPEANRTAIGRGVWTVEGLTNFKEIFAVSDAKRDGQHLRFRLVFLPDGTFLATIGDGGNPPLDFLGAFAREQPQNLQTDFGSVIRLYNDGSVPNDNPFAQLKGARPEIWSFDHRNPQGIVLDPESGAIWASEHGPLGGDEPNRVEKGKNYGWPRVTFGRDYRDGSVISPNIAGP